MNKRIMKDKIWWALVPILLGVQLAPVSAHDAGNERLVFLQMRFGTTYDKCDLREQLGLGIKSKIIFPGKKDDINMNCIVRFSHADFERQFRYCALSGFDHLRQGMGRCYFDRSDGYYHFTAGVLTNKPGDYRHNCNFVCLMKTNGNVSQ